MTRLEHLRKTARRWLKALRAGDPRAHARLARAMPSAPAHPVLRDVQHALARERGHDDWLSLRRAVERRGSGLADLERIEGLSRDFLEAYRSGDPAALARLSAYLQRDVTWDGLRVEVRRRVESLAPAQRPDGDIALADVQRMIAASTGCETWSELVATLTGHDERASSSAPRPRPPMPQTHGDARSGMLQPIELRIPLPMELQGGVYATTTGVWQMLAASRNGDLDTVRTLVAQTPGLARCEYNYMPPLHLAVREGHVDVVRFLIEQGAYSGKYKTYPYGETLLTMAEDRGSAAIAALLREAASRPNPEAAVAGVHGVGHIDFPPDPDRSRLDKLVAADAINVVESLLDRRPDLAHDEWSFYAEGILAQAANRSQRPMLNLLLARGARVPDIAKWGRFYYFKHADVAATLLERGMSPDHMTWHRTTLLHDMAGEGSVEKLKLLLAHGARVDVVDDEFRSTPLGFAARWGRREIVRLLLEHGADPNVAGASWATPLAWAEKKGHRGIAEDLRVGGARV